MICLIMLLLGIGLEIVKANNILIVDNWVIYVCFGVAAVAFVGNIISYFVAKREINNTFKRF